MSPRFAPVSSPVPAPVSPSVSSLQLPSFLCSAALGLPCSVSHHPVGVVVQFASGLAFQQFVALVSWACVPHQVAVSGGVFSVAFGALPAGGL